MRKKQNSPYKIYYLCNIRVCLNFDRFRLKKFFPGISVLTQMIASYLTSENGKKIGRKHKRDLIIFFASENLNKFRSLSFVKSTIERLLNLLILQEFYLYVFDVFLLQILYLRMFQRFFRLLRFL